MSDIVNVRRRASSTEASPQFNAYSKVIIHVSDDSQIEVGDDSGRVLEIDNPLGTQQIANDILTKLRGYQYQPYESSGTLLDPAAEIGDGVSVGNTYGGIYRRGTTFSRLMASDISAPQDEEINHEFKFESPTERMFSRKIGDMQATLRLQTDQIEAKVSQQNDSQSFGWKLLSDRWSVIANGQEVFGIDQNGGTFAGKVVATSGEIGGFTISATAIYNNISEFGGEQSTGVYIGTDGIQLGQGFKVDPSGNMTCTNATVSGTIRAGDIKVGKQGDVDYGQLPGSCVDSYQLSNHVSGGVRGGYSFNAATKSGTSNYPAYFTCGRLNVVNGNFAFGGKNVGTASLTYLDGNGNSRTKTFLVTQ